ncbi:MAG: (Fe-S)-binding protein, partial [Rhodomicrobium sp.]|nr:(Fe-S)-binding protein [Rhodomicrobium sp.]
MLHRAGGERASVQAALFVTCLIDLFRPSAGFAAVKLLEDAGCDVEVPASQTCCGQPAYNSGHREAAKQIAMQVIAAFEHFAYIVVPSGSCAGMLCKHYPGLFDPATEPSWHARATAFASRVTELTAFLSDVLGVDFSGRAYPRRVTYHDSCSSFREM